MSTNFDDEQIILDHIHEISTSDCLIISDEPGSSNFNKTAEVLETILCEDYKERWLDNSKSLLPPDFINEKDSLMMEVMRIDDHSPDGRRNPTLKREKEMHRELKSILSVFPNVNEINCIAVTDLPTEKDHNYKHYYTSFQRTMRKHVSKIDRYRRNHPNKELIFLVVDETSGVYFESVKGNYGRLHCPFKDNRFINEFIEKDIDYLLLYCPYNYFRSVEDHKNLLNLIILDVKHLKGSKMIEFIDYDESRMKSSEM